MTKWRAILVLLVFAASVAPLIAQTKQVVQVKTLDENLHPFPNAEVSFNSGPFVATGTDGSVIAQLDSKSFPINQIRIKDNRFEAASWNYSKGVVQVILRKKNYREIGITVIGDGNKPVANHIVNLTAIKDGVFTTDAKGHIVIPVPLNLQLTSKEQFRIPDYTIQGLAANGNDYTLTVQRMVIETPVQAAPPVVKTSVFDLTQLDSVQSLTVFYAMFKNIDIKNLTAAQQARVDSKFNELVAKQQNASVVKSPTPTFIGNISNSSLVAEDVRNLIRQAGQESDVLGTNRESFLDKIQVITQKLEQGIGNLDPKERTGLLGELDQLEQLLIANENKFFKNQADYRAIIGGLREKYFDVEHLETKLLEAESKRLEQQEKFRDQMFTVSGVLVVFGLLIILLIVLSGRLRKQTKALRLANEEVNAMNENLEEMVQSRTRLLEESHQELDTFLYRSAHDMRAPLRSILGLCNLSEHIPKQELVDKVVRTTSNLDSLLRRLIAISEIGKQNALKTFGKEDIEDLIESHFETMFKQHRIDFHLQMDKELRFDTTPELGEQIIVPLLENAALFSSLDGRPEPRVEMTIAQDKSHIQVVVYDNGIGMDPSARSQACKMFFRGHSKSQGPGLGLYMVYKSATALEGKIFLESEQGRYTRVVVLLPVKAAVAKDLQLTVGDK